jgi:hypothetical protein
MDDHVLPAITACGCAPSFTAAAAGGILAPMDSPQRQHPLTPARIERALVLVARMALLWGEEFDFGPMMDVLTAELKKAKANDQFAKARLILKTYAA